MEETRAEVEYRLLEQAKWQAQRSGEELYLSLRSGVYDITRTRPLRASLVILVRPDGTWSRQGRGRK